MHRVVGGSVSETASKIGRDLRAISSASGTAACRGRRAAACEPAAPHG